MFFHYKYGPFQLFGRHPSDGGGVITRFGEADFGISIGFGTVGISH